jgi:LytTr DNA-binding domain
MTAQAAVEPTPPRFMPAGWVVLLVPVAIGFLLGWLGTEPLSTMPKHLAIAGGIMIALIGWLASDLGSRLVARWARPRGWPLWLVLATGVIVSGPVAVPATYAGYELFVSLGYPVRGIQALKTYTLMHALEGLVGPVIFWTGANLALQRLGLPRYGYLPHSRISQAPAAGEQALLRLMAPRVRGRILAVQAEQHYIRIYTERGNDLIHYRFIDAILALRERRGAQVHRSWWVSLDAVMPGQRDPSRLLLINGISVPAGRTYLREARQAGFWSDGARHGDHSS